MTIWELRANEDYNDAFMIGFNDKICYEKGIDFEFIQTDPFIRKIKIEQYSKGFADIMNYMGIGGSCIVNSKVKTLIEKNFSHLSFQFLPCYSKQFPNIEMWILKVCEYHDFFDINNGVCRTGENLKGEKVIMFIKKYAFLEEAFRYDLFKLILSGQRSPYNLFVSDRFKTIMEENGVTGLNLKAVYTI